MAIGYSLPFFTLANTVHAIATKINADVQAKYKTYTLLFKFLYIVILSYTN